MVAFSSMHHILWKFALVAGMLCLMVTEADAYSEYKTCCAIQSACNNCTSLYKVNSITYCCPNCQGEVLVTALRCTCTVVVKDPHYTPTCTVSNKVVGDYYYGLTSWNSPANLPLVSVPALLLAVCFVRLFVYRNVC